jgi:hypothetical protein
MRILEKISLIFLWALFLSCDLLFNKPDGNLMQDIEDSVWDSNAPRLEVAMDYIAGAGTTNFAKGLIVPQPKQRIEFAVSFAVNPEYGFVEWRAYKTGERPGSEEEWQAVAAVFKNIVKFGSPRDLSTTVLIDSDKGLITLEPFCVRRPEVDHSDPVWTGSSNRFYTNQPIRIWFTMPIERESVQGFDNISISAVTFQGTGATIDLVERGYFEDPGLDENGTMLLISPDMEAYPEGLPPNSDITIRLGINIRHEHFTGIDGGEGLRMARPFVISYGTAGGPDKSVPQVYHVLGAEKETDPLFEQDESSPPLIKYRENKAEVFLLFNAYKPTDTPIRNVVIYEEPVPEDDEQPPYPVEELSWNAWGGLEGQYIDAYASLSGVPPLGGGRTKVRYRIRTKQEGPVKLYILPEDSVGNKVSLAEAKTKGYFMPVTIDPPPAPVEIADPPVYDPAMRQIKLSWTPPAPGDEVTTLEILWKKNGVETTVPNSTIPKPYDYRFDAGAWDVPNIGGENDDEYTITIKASDGDGNYSLSKPVTVRAKQPKPITGVSTVYDSAARKITVSWDDPGIANLQDQLVYWSKDGDPAGEPVSVGKVERSYTLEDVPDDSSVYRFDIVAVDAEGNTSASGEAGFSPEGGIIHVPPVTGLEAAYDPEEATISVGWTNPPEGDFTGLTLGWSNGAGASGTVELEAVDAHDISNVNNNSGLYTITVKAKNGVESVPAVIQVNTAVVPPVTGLLAGYSLATRKITVNWTNPAPASAFTGLTLAWKTGETVLGSRDLGKVEAYAITGIDNDGGPYVVEVRAKNGTVLSKAAVASVNTAHQKVSYFNLKDFVTAPVTGAAPDTGAISHAQYAGTIAWKESDGTTAVGGNFAVSRVYKAVVTLTASAGYAFDGVGANVFSYAGATVTNPTGTGATITATITFPALGLYYVKASRTGQGTGVSWDNASDDLQAMIDAAHAAGGGIVRVAAGTYTPRYKPASSGASMAPPVGAERDKTFMLRPGVEILGGYPASATGATGDSARNWAANVTILSGDIDNNDNAAGITGNNAHHVVLGVDVPNAVLDGFTIKGGKADGSSIITVKGKEVAKRSGGGIYSDSSSPVLTNLTIVGNFASDDGGGMCLVSSPSILTNVLIAGNTAGRDGGGIHNSLSLSILTNVTVAGNSAASGGGMYIADNSFNSNPPKIRNSIIWGNSESIMVSSGGPTLDYNIVQGGSTWANSSNNLDMDPAFVAPAAGDYRLTVNSPAINRGSDSYYEAGRTPDLSAIAKDIGGAARSVGGTIDMGAYEEPGGIKIFPITLTISDEGEGAFSQATFTVSKAASGSRTIAVTGTGYSNPRWHVDGFEKGTGNSIVINAAQYRTGAHSLSLWVEKNAVPWSKELEFTVTD